MRTAGPPLLPLPGRWEWGKRNLRNVRGNKNVGEGREQKVIKKRIRKLFGELLLLYPASQKKTFAGRKKPRRSCVKKEGRKRVSGMTIFIKRAGKTSIHHYNRSSRVSCGGEKKGRSQREGEKLFLLY